MARIVIDGAETGDLSELEFAGSGLSATSSQANGSAGNYSYTGTDNVSTSSWTFSLLNNTRVFTKVAFAVSSVAAGSPAELFIQLALFQDTGAAQQCVVYYQINTSAVQKIVVYDSSTVQQGSATVNFNANEFHTIEMDFTKGAGTGAMTVYVDGISVIAITGKQFGANNIGRWGGMSSDGNLNGRNFYFDDCELDDTKLCGATYIIARQIAAGTPTYDNWTKSNGSTIDTVWSDTPFSTATFASSATASQAQTGLVADFSSTSTGHGSGVIKAVPINGIRGIAIAKTASTAGSGASMSLRRRFNGVDTDTAVTLTTSDAAYATPIFTDTIANLDASEFGAVHGAGSTTTQTVEDVFMIASYPAWPTWGEQVQPVQPPHRRFERAAAVMRGDDGIQGPFIRFFNFGWPVQPWQPPHPRREKHTGTIARGDDGIKAPFIRWFNAGWAVQPHQPQHPRREKSGAIMHGDDGTQKTYTYYVNIWDATATQPMHPRPERFGAIAPYSNGIEFPFVPPASSPWFESSPALLPHRVYKNPDVGDIDGNDFPQINFFDLGFPVQPPQPPHPRPERGGAFMRGDDGNEYPQINFYDLGFPIQSPQPPHPRPERAGALMRGDDGAESPFIQFFPFGWPIQPPQPPHTKSERGAIMRGEDGIEFPFINWLNAGWAIQPHQPQHPRPERAGAIARGDDGTEFPFIVFYPAGWAVQPPQPPHPRRERSGSIMRGDDGTEFPFVPPFAPTWAFDPLAPLKTRKPVYAALKGRAEFAFFAPWQNFGWEIQAWQPPHPTPERRSGAIARLDDGIQFPLIQFYPYGWAVQPPQPPHPRPERAASFLFGDTGTEAPFIFVSGITTGWEVQPWQPPHPWREKREGAITRWDDGTEFPFIRWFNIGFEPTLGFPERVFRERRAAIFRGDDGIQRPFLQWRNLWEPTLGFPQRVIRERRQGGIARGDDGIEAPFIRFFNYGWPVQPWQPPHRRVEKAGGIMVGDNGIQRPFVPPPSTFGFSTPDTLARIPFNRAGAIIFRGDDGIYLPIPPGPPPVSPERRHAVQLLVIGDADAFIGPTSIGYTGGTRLVIYQPANMIFDLKTQISPLDPIDITLIAPDGSVRHGDPDFSYASAETVQYYTFLPFQPYQYIVYTFAEGELDQIGLWHIYVTVGQYTSSIRTFEVTRKGSARR